MMLTKRFLVALTLVLLVLSLFGPTLVSAKRTNVRVGQASSTTVAVSSTRDRGGVPGTTLSAYKTAMGYWERYYDWTVEKDADPEPLTLSPNQSETVTFTITATRGEPTDVYGVRGRICVTNGGSKPTENLTITDVVQYKVGAGQFHELTRAVVDTSAKPVLGPGESWCYPYDVQFTPVPGAQYRNVALVKITNHSGSINQNAQNCKPGTPCGPEPKTSFWLPAMPTEIDETATLTDELDCPEGFECSPSGPWTWNLTGSWSQSLEVTVTNVSACDSVETRVGALTNTATLTEDDTGQTRTATASVTVYADCPTQPGGDGGYQGCTYTQGYWQRWTDRWPMGYSPDDPFYNSGQTWIQVLRTPTRGNAYYILAHQFIAATLNVANGATAPEEVQAALANAAAYFATADPNDPYATTPRADLVAWAGTLDRFNNGYIGPGHCD
ncbi:MAG: hypothetical protein NZ761_07750 [Dehalococcoidia bacterium]|nr:hypothetical protein [Dehalococcoidia bacterium]MDW7983021.1 hypothetical protein [Thermomicrobium sp.]